MRIIDLSGSQSYESLIEYLWLPESKTRVDWMISWHNIELNANELFQMVWNRKVDWNLMPGKPERISFQQ